MRVLWICNIMLPMIAEQLNLPYSNREGWLSGLADKLLSRNAGEIQLGICFPVEKSMWDFEQILALKENTTCYCYGFEEDLNHPEKYSHSLEKRFQYIFDSFQPDMIHIFGTEFPHTLAAVKVYNRPDRTLIGLQGLCSAIAKVYSAKIPLRVKYIPTLRDVLKQDSIWQQQDKYKQRGVHEIEALKLTGHVTGRTDFDMHEMDRINPNAVYHFMNETMRAPFYSGSWNPGHCEKYSIFLSQGDYPLKGFHFLLQAMPKVLEQYPDAMVYVAGSNLLEKATLKDRLKRSAYGRYLGKLIRQNHLSQHVVMLGRLTAQQMKEQYLRSNVFVCPSILENSPNSLGEAMLLGVPCIASKVGGIPNMLEESQDGMLFPAGDSEALADRIIEMFQKEELARQYSINAKRHAYRTHDGDVNYRHLLDIYEDICASTTAR